MSLGLEGLVKRKREIRKRGRVGSSGLRELRTEGSGVFSVLRDGPWKVLTCCGLLIYRTASAISFVPVKHPPPRCPPTVGRRAWGGESERLLRGRFLEGSLRWPPEWRSAHCGIGGRGGGLCSPAGGPGAGFPGEFWHYLWGNSCRIRARSAALRGACGTFVPWSALGLHLGAGKSVDTDEFISAGLGFEGLKRCGSSE